MTAPHKDTIRVYADGSCLGNPGPGGWGVVLIDQSDRREEFYGGDPETTNNRMELRAAIEALRHTPPGARVELWSDSQYVIYTMTKEWKRKKNLELWNELDAEKAAREVDFQWVRGHGSDPLNDRADELALKGAKLAAGGKIKPGAVMKVEAEQAAPTREAGLERERRALTNEAERWIAPTESVRECKSCGESFVTDAQHPASHCSRLACQKELRRGR